MTQLILNFLGSPEVTFADKPLKFRSRKVLGLLIFLVVTGERQSREKLVDLLWPQSDYKKGMASLRNSVARLKKALTPAGEFLLTERGYIGFDHKRPFFSDINQLQTAFSAEASLSSQIETLALYRGEFLAGFDLLDAPDYEQWVTQQRALFAQQWETLFVTVAQQQLDEGNGRLALETATRLAHIMPTSETAVQLQMKAHALSGQQGAALRRYEQFSQLLMDELGVEPAPETAVLAQKIGKGGHSFISEATSPPAPTERPSLQIPFMGRSAERRQLQYCYHQAEQGNPHVALIVGDAGQGKTALADTFLQWAALQSSHPDIIRGRAFEMGGHLPYQPLVEGMRTRLNEENAPEDLLDDVWLAELSQLLPELRGRYPDLPQPMAGSPDFVRARLFEAMATLGIALGEKRPFILYIDDLQWADAGTLDLLLYLVQRFTAVRLPMLFLITMRREGLQAEAALRDWVQQVVRQNALAQIDLEPLPEHTLQQLFSQLTQQYNLLSDEAKQLGQWLHQQTSGSPFYMMALLQMLVDQELLVGEPNEAGEFVPDLGATLLRIQAMGHVPLPPTVREVVTNRLNLLPERAQTLLLAAAIIGRACTFERLCQMTGMELFAALPALEALLTGQLLIEAQEGERPLTIAHDNIRDVAYTEAGVTKRRLFHRQLFTLIEQEDAPAAELAFHADAAHLHQKSFDYAVTAGDESLAVHAFTDAIAFYEQALDVAERVQPSVAQQCHLCVHYGRSLELAGRYHDALNHYIEMNEVAQKSGNKPLELATLAAQGTIYSTANELSDFELGEKVSLAALTLAESLEDEATQAKIQWNLLNVYRMLGNNDAALAAGETSLRLAQKNELKEAMAYAANDLVYVYMALGDNQRTLELERQATELWRELGNQPMLTDSLINLASTTAFMGSFVDALTITEEPLAISQSLNNKWAQSYSLFPAILVNRRYFDVEKTLALMDRGIQLAEEAGFTGMQTIIGAHKAQLLTAVGALRQAKQVAQQARQIADNNIPLFSPLSIGTQLIIALAEDNLPEAEQLAKLIPLNRTEPDVMNYLLPELAMGHLAIAQHRYAIAKEIIDFVLALLVAQKYVIFQPEFYYLQGLALAKLGQEQEARDALQAGLKVLRETNGRLWYIEIVSLLIELEGKARGGTAVSLRQEARATLHYIVQHIPEGELRASFLVLPEVRGLMANIPVD